MRMCGQAINAEFSVFFVPLSMNKLIVFILTFFIFTAFNNQWWTGTKCVYLSTVPKYIFVESIIYLSIWVVLGFFVFFSKAVITLLLLS